MRVGDGEGLLSDFSEGESDETCAGDSKGTLDALDGVVRLICVGERVGFLLGLVDIDGFGFSVGI